MIKAGWHKDSVEVYTIFRQTQYVFVRNNGCWFQWRHIYVRLTAPQKVDSLILRSLHFWVHPRLAAEAFSWKLLEFYHRLVTAPFIQNILEISHYHKAWNGPKIGICSLEAVATWTLMVAMPEKCCEWLYPKWWNIEPTNKERNVLCMY